MRFYWTTEASGYALRDQRGYTRGAITSTGRGKGYWGLVFQRGLPDSGPYKNRQDAANWVQKMLSEPDSTFGELPPWAPLTYEEIFA